MCKPFEGKSKAKVVSACQTARSCCTKINYLDTIGSWAKNVPSGGPLVPFATASFGFIFPKHQEQRGLLFHVPQPGNDGTHSLRRLDAATRGGRNNEPIRSGTEPRQRLSLRKL